MLDELQKVLLLSSSPPLLLSSPPPLHLIPPRVLLKPLTLSLSQSLSLSLSLYLSLSLSLLSQSICLSLCLSLSISISLSNSLSLPTSLALSLSLSLPRDSSLSSLAPLSFAPLPLAVSRRSPLSPSLSPVPRQPAQHPRAPAAAGHAAGRMVGPEGGSGLRSWGRWST